MTQINLIFPEIIILLLSVGYCTTIGLAGQKDHRFEWEKATPESQGMSAEKLEKARLLLEKRRTEALLVIRNDKIILEWYAKGMDKSKKHYTASLAKSIVGGMALLVALNDGNIGIDDFAYKYIPQWKDEPLKSKITIRMLATHSSGIEDAEENNLLHEELTGWKGQFWNQDPDPFTIIRDQAPVVFKPGTQCSYCSVGFAMLAYSITASIHDSPQSDIYTLLKERIIDPIGIFSNEWKISYGNKVWDIEDMKLYAVWGGGSYTPRAVARIGRLLLRKGTWEGDQLIKSDWVESVISFSGGPLPERSKENPYPGAALCWWSNFDGVWGSLPHDAFVGVGAGHQILLVVPSLDMIVVRFGSLLDREKGLLGLFDKYIYNRFLGSEEKHSFWGDAEKYIFDPIVDSIRE